MAEPTTDAKVTAGASATVNPPVPAPAPAKPEEKKEEGKSSDIKVDSKSVYVAPEIGYVWRGAGNSTEDTHTGPSVGVTIGYPTLLFGDRFYLRLPEFRYRKEWVSRSIPAEFGQGIDSSANIDMLGLGTTFGVNIIRWIGAELDFKYNIAHIGSTASTDGKQGFRYGDNRFAYSVDNWGHGPELRLAVGLPEQKVAPWLQIGAKVFGSIGYNSWSFTPDSISRSPSDPPIGVGSTYGEVGLTVVGRFGEVAKPYKSSSEPEEKKVAPVAAAPAAVPQGVKDIQAMVDPMKAEVKKQLEMKYADNAAGYAKDAAEKADSKKKDDHAIALDSAKLAVQESQKAGAAYKAATDTVTKADAALAELKKDTKISPENIKLAEDAVAAMRAEADKLKEEAHKTWESAGNAVKSYNSIKGLPKKEQIEFKDEDPAKAAAPAAPVEVKDVKVDADTKPKTDKPKALVE